MRFLFCPAFKFNQDVAEYLDSSTTAFQGSAERILVMVNTSGLRLRNLSMSKSVTCEVSGSLVTVTYFENEKSVESEWLATDEINVICEKIIRFFNK